MLFHFKAIFAHFKRMIYHKKIFSAVFVLLSFVSLHAQISFNAVRGEASGTEGSLSYTVGQTVYDTYTGSTGSVAQVVQLTYDITALLGAEISDIKLELVAYPNLTQETHTLKINNYNNDSLIYQLYDLQGKLWDSQPVKGAQTELEMKDLAVGTYY